MIEQGHEFRPQEFQELERLLAIRNREISALERAARTSAAMGRLRGEDLYRLLNQQVADLLDVEKCVILLYDADREALVGQVPAVGVSDDVIRAYSVPLHEGSPARQYWLQADPLVINDVMANPLVRMMHLDELAREADVRSALIVGLRDEGKLLGVIQPLNKRDGSGFLEDDVRLLSIFASQAATIIRSAGLLEESQRHAEEMASLYEMAAALGRAVGMADILHAVLSQVRRVLDYDACLITLPTVDGKALRFEAVDGPAVEGLLGLEQPLEQGINAWIFKEAKPTLVADADADPRRLHIDGQTESIRAAVGAPLIVDGQAIGTIYATRHQPQAFTQAHLDFLIITAAQVAVAVQKARLLDQTRQRAEEMETLYAIAAVMASSLDVEQILCVIYEQAGRIMDTAAFFVALYDEDKDELCFNLVYDREERLEPFSIRFSESQGLTAYVIRTAQPLLIRNWEIEREQFPINPLLVGDPTLSWLGVPIVVQDQVVGAIGAQSYEAYAFTGRHLRLLSAIANQAGISLQNAKLVADLKLVNTDLQEMVDAQAHLLQTIEEMITTASPDEGGG